MFCCFLWFGVFFGYLVKSVFICTLSHAVFLSWKGSKFKGAFALAQMKHLPRSTGKEWLLMKKKDGHAKEGYEVRTELTPARLKTLREKVPPCETE
jgi:hypothetical protein